MGLPKRFDYLKTVEVVLQGGGTDATCYAVTCNTDDLGDLECMEGSGIVGGPWIFTAARQHYRYMELADIAEALEALNALENGGSHE